jgi:DnaJ-class molecular chaperone
MKEEGKTPINSTESPSSASARGACWNCAGKKELVSEFGGERREITCPTCHGTGRER